MTKRNGLKKLKKPQLRIFLMFAMTLSTIASVYFLSGAFAGTGSSIASLAISEGKAKYDCNRYTTAYGQPCHAWCADFVSWVYWKRGAPLFPFPGRSYNPNPYWNYHSVDSLQDFFTKTGSYYSNTSSNRKSNPPKAGDVFFKASGSHAGIITKVYGSGDGLRIDVASGNSTNSRTNYQTASNGYYPISYTSGWGRYRAIAISTTDSRQVVDVQISTTFRNSSGQTYFDYQNLSDSSKGHWIRLDERKASWNSSAGQYRGDFLYGAGDFSGPGNFYTTLGKAGPATLIGLRVNIWFKVIDSNGNKSAYHYDWQDLGDWKGELITLQVNGGGGSWDGSKWVGDFLKPR